MKISDIKIKSFLTYADRWDQGHALPKPDTELMQTVLTIETDEGISGHFIGGGTHGDQEGKHFVHISYFAPGEDLHDDQWDKKSGQSHRGYPNLSGCEMVNPDYFRVKAYSTSFLWRSGSYFSKVV